MSRRKEVLKPLRSLTNHLPMTIGDYADFYAGRNQAQSVCR